MPQKELLITRRHDVNNKNISYEDIPSLAYAKDVDNILKVTGVIRSIHDKLIKKETIEISPLDQTLKMYIENFKNNKLKQIVQYFSTSIPDLINKEPDGSLRMYLEAIISLMCGNEYSAKARIGGALHLNPDFQAARQLFQVAFPDLKPGDTADGWAEVVTDVEEFAQKQIAAAISSFKSRQFEMADHYLQLYNSLRFINYWASEDLATCRAVNSLYVRDGIYDRLIDRLAEDKRYDYATNWPNRANEYIKEYVESVDGPIISGIAELAIEFAPNRRFLDFGSYVCIVPMAIRKRIGDGLFHAVEPDAQAVDYVRENLDFVTIHHGGHEEMINGKFDIPDVDVVIAYRVLGIIHPKELARIFAYLAGKTRRFLIFDDVFNFDGNCSVIRLGVSRYAHNYGRMLEAVGFRSQTLRLPPCVERYLTGTFIAER